MDGGGSADEYRPPDGAEIKTFLIADVRGYTMFTNERGDEAAAKLAAKFAAIVREGVEARGGSLVELRGDEGLAVFSSARQAIRAAMDLQSAFVDETLADPSLPLLVGIGLDAGEAVAVEGGYRGGALNLAARLCGQAGPGETLASQEVVHLARKVEGVRYVERGAVHLKGLDQPVLVIRVMLEEGDPAERLAGVVTTPSPVRRARPRRSVVLVAAVATIALVAATLPFVLHHDTPVPALAANGIQLIDATSGQRVGSVPLPGSPGGIASGGGSVWVSDPQAGTVVRLDPSTRAAVDTIQVGRDPAGIAFGDGAVWVAVSGDGELARIDPSTDTVVSRVGVGNGPTGVAVSSGFVWVTNYTDNTVVRVDTTTNKVVSNSRVDVGNGPVSVTANAAGAWVADSGDGTVTRIPLGGQGTTTIRVGNGPSGIAIGPTAVWVTNSLDGTLSRIDADTGVVLQTTPVGDGPTGVIVDIGTVWVADHFGEAIARVDATTGASSAPIQMDAAPVEMALVRGELWVAASAPQSAHRGGTLQFASEFAPDSIDPATAYSSQAWQILSLVNDGLVGFERVGGAQGGTIVADLASSVPVPSDGGRTYTFQLRPGIHYSNGAAVEPQDFRLGIERMLLIRSGTPTYYYSGIVGAARCISGASCNLSKGIVVNDATRTVTFHLTAPDPEFLYRLALPFADAVPAGTPLTPIGATPIPATGPYMIASYTPGPKGAIELVRNPRFVEWSQAAQPDGYPDRIEGSYGISAAQQVSKIEQGRLDVMDDSPPPHLLSQLDTRYPSQIREVVLPLTRGFALNSQVPPFDDVRVRQALNYAVDRRDLVRISGGPQLAQVSCQILPPDFPGYQPYCPYTLHPSASGTWSAPDPGLAQRLVAASGTRGAQIIVWTPRHFPQESAGRYLVSILDGLGYRARLHVLSPTPYFHEIGDPQVSATVQISAFGWLADYPAPSGTLVPLFACSSVAAGTNTSHFCDRRVQTEMDKALALEVNEPAAAGEAWARVDRSIVDRAPWLALPTPLQVYFVSSRTSNVQVSPQWGMLLSQLWIH